MIDRAVLDDLADFAREHRVARLVYTGESVDLTFLPPEPPRPAAPASTTDSRSRVPPEARALGGAYASEHLWRHCSPVQEPE